MKQTTLIWLFNNKNQISLCMKKRWFWVWKLNWAWWKLNPWETVKECAVRELEEETWVKVDLSSVVHRWLLHFAFENKPEWDQETNLFTAKYNWELFETEEMKPYWIDIDKIPYDKMCEDDLEYSFLFDENGKILKYERIR